MRHQSCEMDRATRLKIAQCLAYGFLFQFLGWEMRTSELDLKALKYGGRITFIMGTVLLAYGASIYVTARGFWARFGGLKSLGMVALAVAACMLLFSPIVRPMVKAGLSEDLAAFLVLVGVECLIFHWADQQKADTL